MRIRSAALLALLPAVVTGAPAAAHSEELHLVVTQEAEVGRADVAVAPAGGGWAVTGTITRTAAEAGCLTLAAVPADPEPGEDPLAGGEVLGVHCGPGTVPVTGEIEHGVMVLVWDGTDGLPVAWVSSPLRDGSGA